LSDPDVALPSPIQSTLLPAASVLRNALGEVEAEAGEGGVIKLGLTAGEGEGATAFLGRSERRGGAESGVEVSDLRTARVAAAVDVCGRKEGQENKRSGEEGRG
jgi:hypothetical protein